MCTILYRGATHRTPDLTTIHRAGFTLTRHQASDLTSGLPSMVGRLRSTW